ncbi:Holliday junction branch migration protein RuvA [Candidatus Gribaldobacteria bacterium]|nr:Holliday junction branch migration protein RuvA [Candidatus Gribaldobacteria bacterium]
MKWLTEKELKWIKRSLIFRIFWYNQTMIAYLQGKIILKTQETAILEVNGVGYELFLAEKALEKVPEIGQDFSFYCQLEANDRGVKLYGFLTFQQLDLFKTIRSIQGIGPKASLDISALGSLEEIKTIIEKGEAIPGIGPKKAQKIILELTGKIKTQNKTKNQALENDEAYLALANLGFKKQQIVEALSKLPKEIIDSQTRIKKALALISK